MRNFSGLYFFLRVATYLCVLLSHTTKSFLYINHWSAVGTLLFFVTLIIALAKPYHKACMNYWDIAILSNLSILFYVLSSGSCELLLARILLSIPITVFVLTVVLKILYDLFKVSTKLLLQNCCKCFRCRGDAEANRRLTIDSPTEVEQLVQPTSTIMICNYGAKRNEAI